MLQAENQAPIVEEEPLQRRQARRCRPLTHNTAEKSNKSRDKVHFF